MVNYPSLPGLRGFPGHRTFYAKTGTVPRNLGPVDHPTLRTAGSQSFWRPSERLHGTQLRIISMKGKEVEYLSTNPQWLRITPRHYFSVTPDLTCAGAGHAPVPRECPLKERHRKMLACLWSVCRQTLGSAKGTWAGHQHYLIHDYFFPIWWAKEWAQCCFHWDSLFSGEFRTNFIFASLFEHLKTG